ncbi:MAG: thermostable hemolysin delta-VPH [Pseudoruminococcus massiliensis]|uniref:thermostable hemolysin delta-VPH n=3 Tax=Pseudoruminococcus massiliensis TaxID=2086583 RepID=UPI0038B58365
MVMLMYYNYHSVAKKLIREGKLIDWYYIERHNKISPALVLIFDDFKHPVMPIREDRWNEYEQLINSMNDKIK